MMLQMGFVAVAVQTRNIMLHTSNLALRTTKTSSIKSQASDQEVKFPYRLSGHHYHHISGSLSSHLSMQLTANHQLH